MARRKAQRLMVSTLAAAVGLPVSAWSAWAQDGGVPVQPAPATPGAPVAGDDKLAFNFKDAALDQVLDFFARQSGVPVIYEAAIPAGTITFVSSSRYTFDEALSILNLNLARFGVHLRHENQFLYLATLADAMKKGAAIASDAKGLAELTPDKMVTVSIPLDNAKSEQVAEQVKVMVGPYGGVLAIPAQNMLVVVESVAQVRRIREVVAAIDSRKPADASFRLFALQYASCDAVLNALKGLVSEKRSTVIVDKDGGQRVVQDQNIQGLNLAADQRTNSIIAVGPEARIKMVAEVVSLLDVPENAIGGGSGLETGFGGSAVELRTFTLTTITADEAAKQVGALFAALDPKRRPVVLPLATAGRITVIGAKQMVAQAGLLLGELDPGAGAGELGSERRAVTIPLKHATPAMIEALVTRLGTPRQQQVLKMAATPDGKGVLVIGPLGDIEAVEELVAALDVPADADREVRVVRVMQGEPSEVLAKARDLYVKTGKAERRPVTATLDGEGRTVTMVGGKDALVEFDALLSTLQAVSGSEQEARRFQLKRGVPSVLAGKLSRLARSMLNTSGGDGAGYVEPVFEPVDELGMLVVRAQGAQFRVLDALVEQLDAASPIDRSLRIFPVANEKAGGLRDRALVVYGAQVAQMPNAQPIEVSVDERSNALMVVADTEGMARFTKVMDELGKQAGAAREVRLIDLKVAKAAEVAEFLKDLARASESLTIRGGPEPVFEVIESTNQIMVAAQPAQFAVIEALARGLDAKQSGERPPMRILKLRTTDAANLAGVLQKSFDARPAEERGRLPVSIEADAATNTLIVSAHADVLPEIEAIAGELNETDAADGTGREIRIFPLRVARAEELAQTIDQMYPDQPVPLDPRTRQPRPDLKPPREVVVRADRATNALIVDAPAKRLAGFEQLVKSLDQAKLAENVSLRTYRVVKADLAGLAATLRNLAATGSLGNQTASGPVTVSTDGPTRTLIVSGPTEVFAGVEDVLKRLDGEGQASPTDMKLYTLESARAERIGPLVERVLTSRAREMRLAAGNPMAEGERTVEVTPDAASNTLIVSAPPGVLTIADGIVRALDQQSVSSAVEVRVFRLQKGEATGVATAVTAALRAQDVAGVTAATVTPEPASNTVVVVGTGEQLERAAKLVESMDASVDRDGMGVRTISLKHARAESLAPVLEGVLARESSIDRLPDWMRAQVLSRGGAEPARVKVAAEPRLNALVVSGPKQVIDMAEQVVAELDVAPGSGQGQDRAMRVITLQNADATQLALSLEAVFKDAAAAGEEPAPVIRVDSQSNSLIVRATPGQMTRVDELAAKLDGASMSGARQMRMIAVDPSRADAEMLARTLKRLIEQQGGAKVEVISAEELMKRGGGTGEVPSEKPVEKKVGRVDDRGSRSLDARGGLNGVWMAGMAGVAGVLAQPEPVAEATTVAVEAASPMPAQPDEEAGVTIAVDRATNSILVVGSPRMADRLADLARQLESQMPGEPTGVKIVTLPAGAEAEPLAQMVRQTVMGIGRLSATNPGGFTGPVNIAVDPTGGALIVLSNATDFETVGALIGTMSSATPGVKVTVKVYPLTSISAVRARQAVEDLFSATPRGAQARRVREVELSLPGGGAVSGKVDISQVRMTSDPGGSALIVAAPDEAMGVIDRLIETLDQAKVTDRLAIRRYEVKNAKADELARTLQALFEAQRQGLGNAAGDVPAARFVGEARTNTLLVTASDSQHRDVARLVEQSDASMGRPGEEMAIITLKQAAPSTVRRVVDEVLIGRDPARKDRIQISAEDGSNVLFVRASKEDLEEVREIVAQVDQAETGGLPVRPIKLERADAGQVAAALQQFFRDRTALSAGRGASRVAVVGDKRSGTLVVSASDDDFAQVQELVKTFDTPTPSQDLRFKVIALKNARVGDVAATIKSIVDEVRWETAFAPGGAGAGGRREGVSLHLETNERTNSLVLVGQGEAMETAEKVILALDVPEEARAAMTIRSVKVKSADVQALRNVLQRAFVTPGWRSWRGADPDALTVEVDRAQRALILVGKADRVEQAAKYVAELDSGPDGSGLLVEAITLSHARADRAAASLRQFFADRARAQGVEQTGVSVIGSQDGNVVIASANEDGMKVLKDLIAQIDQPDGGKDRRIEVIVLRNGLANDVANSLRAMFARGTRDDERVVITPQPSTNSVIISAPAEAYAEVAALVGQLDAAPKAEEANIETVALTSARAQDVALALRTALPPTVKVTVTPVVRSNSLLLTGSKEAIAIVLEQVKKIDTEPVRSGLIFRRFRLESAEASDVSYTVGQMLRARPRGATEAQASIDYNGKDNTLTVYAPADQIEEIETIVRELDQAPGDERTTEFVRLEFANASQTATALRVFYGRSAPEASGAAARSVTILPDSLSNSLVIRADKTQWEGIRALLAKLDTKEYDTTRQLAVIALEHADAAGVARALNEGLRAPLEEQLRQAQLRTARQRTGQPFRPGDERAEPTVLVDAEGVPTVSAEAQTNSLIVFAGGKELERIREIVRQIDVAGFKDMPTPRIIALRNGKPSAVATTIREMYLNRLERVNGPRAVLVIGDDATGALLVRADDEKFAQIKALAETLEQQGEIGRVTPHVLRLKHVAAGRLRQTLLATFAETARAQGETLAVEIDRASNALVVACSPRLLEEVKRVLEELDQPAFGTAPDGTGAGLVAQNVTIVDVTNNDPVDIKRTLDDMGLTKPQAEDRPGVVSEQVTISVMTSRRALAIVGAPGDGKAVEALVRALDAAPMDAQQQVRVIPLKMATAATLATTLNAMLRVDDPANGLTGPARALTEQVRRLQLTRNGVTQPEGVVDLSRPIKVLADAESNSVILTSSQANVEALAEVVKVLDTLPTGDAVVMRILPLENASAVRVKAVIEELFRQGEQLRRLPGTRRLGLPPTATGQALAGEIAVSVDERTNTLIVAGREEACALVEVVVKDLDGDRVSKWVEPQIVPLKHADARTLAARLNEVLVRGLSTTPEAAGLQKQFGRLRMVQTEPAVAVEGQAPLPATNGYLEADLFAPITGMVITAEENMNALLVVGTPANNAVVRALVEQLDVEAASAANTVRVFPLQFAAAERVSAVLRDVFRQRVEADQDKPEDRLIITTDVRTNSLIVSTSPRSFGIVEGLLKTLDGEGSNYSVGLHVLAVTNADVRQLAPRIERLMRERIQAAAQVGTLRNPLDAFSIEPEPGSNLLIVACSDENLVVVKELIEALSTDSARLAAGERVDIVQLTRGRAAEIALSLEQLYVEKENARRGDGAVRVVANERLNALVISGNEQDLIELRALAKKLDNAEFAQKQQIKWIELRSANAGEVTRLIQSVLAGRPVGGGSGLGARQATRLQFLRETVRDVLVEGAVAAAPSEADIDGAIRDQVTLNADTRTNSIWITAPEAMVTLISEMIQDIDESSAGARRIEKFRLLNADAVRMRELLRDIFQMEQQGESLVLVPSPNRAPGVDGQPGMDPGMSGASVTPVPDERQQLSIAVDERTNTLIVSGTDEYLGLVRKVVTELDAISATDRERRVYPLRNAKAKEIETTLRSYFQGEADKERLTLGTERVGSLMKALEEEVTVVGDEASNKLVISTSPRYMESVLAIVDELDQTPPQVMIQVLLAEVTVDSGEQWGMDAKVGPLGGDGVIVGSTAQGVGVATALGVPNLSVTSADFGVLIRALELQGKLEILSNPQVLANNNMPAEIKVVDDIGLAGETQRGFSSNAIVSTVQRQDVGIILKVTPAISNDGFVRMEISPEISSLTSRTTQINRDQTAPIISKRTVDTVVTVKDGQSVVIGGLIQTTDENRTTNVPFLGEIPILGLPFRTKQNSMSKTELLVILTPRVISNESTESDALVRDVTEQQIDRLDDPTRVEEFLERIKLEIQQHKARTNGPHAQPAPAPALPTPVGNPSTPDLMVPSNQESAPAPAPDQRP